MDRDPRESGKTDGESGPSLHSDKDSPTVRKKDAPWEPAEGQVFYHVYLLTRERSRPWASLKDIRNSIEEAREENSVKSGTVPTIISVLRHESCKSADASPLDKLRRNRSRIRPSYIQDSLAAKLINLLPVWPSRKKDVKNSSATRALFIQYCIPNAPAGRAEVESALEFLIRNRYVDDDIRLTARAGDEREFIDRLARHYDANRPLIVTPTSETIETRPSAAVSIPLCIAVDSTLLIEADSYLLPTLIDGPDAMNSFEFAVTIFCGCRDLYLKKPPKMPDQATPFVRLFWESANGSPLDVAFTKQRDIENSYRLAGAFRDVLRTQLVYLTDWVSHVLTNDRLATIYWSAGSSMQTMRLMADVLRETQLLDTADLCFPTLNDRVFTLGGEHALVGREFKSRRHYALTYSFAQFARGTLYAFQFQDKAAYHPHWLRRDALLRGLARERLEESFFPWGPILRELCYQTWRPPLGDYEERVFCDNLRRLRDFTLAQQKAGGIISGRDAIRAFIVDGLKKSNFMSQRKALTYLSRWNLQNPAPMKVAAQKTITGDSDGQPPSYWHTLDDLAKILGRKGMVGLLS